MTAHMRPWNRVTIACDGCGHTHTIDRLVHISEILRIICHCCEAPLKTDILAEIRADLRAKIPVAPPAHSRLWPTQRVP